MLSQSDPAALLARFEQHLIGAGYTRPVTAHYLDAAERFLGYLSQRHIRFAVVQPSHLSAYLRDQLQRYRRRYGHSPASMASWRHWHTAGVRRLLHVVLGEWPPTSPPTSPYEALCRQVCDEYAQELRERRALVACTVSEYVTEARRFLAWVGQRASVADLSALTVSDIDRYLKARTATIRRATRKAVTLQVRGFLRFLHGTGRIARDLASSVIAPTLYRFEAIPSVLRPEQIEAILASARKDRSAKGLRDYAMLMLLATYGLRAGEVRGLRLEDVDWRGERLWIRHTKTRARSCLPLLPTVGQALLDYLERGRPKCTAREIFIRSNAPRCGFFTSSALYSVLRRHLAQIGIRLNGRRGPHALRHARAVSLLRAAVPVKTIGDVLGHRSAASTTAYLKLADQELRSVALSIPTPEAQP